MSIQKLKDIRKKLASFDAEKEAVNTLKEFKEFIEELNADQLLEGKQPNGSKITPEYLSDSYAAFKARITPNAKRSKFTPNLKLTGKFHNSITVEFFENHFIIKSSDPKAKKLFTKYGSILGVSEDGRVKIRTELRAELLVVFKNTLDL